MRFAASLLVLLLWATSSAFADDDFDTQMMRATVKLAHDSSTGTGFILWREKSDDFVLVTAAHVFNNIRGDETSIVYRIKRDEGNYERRPVPLRIRKDGAALWQQHPKEDVAVISVSPPAEADLPKISTARLATDDMLRRQKIHPGEMVSLLGYPHREEGSEAGFSLLRAGAIASYPVLPTAKTQTFYLSINSFEGDSGGPVYVARPSLAGDASEPLILGLIHGQRFIDEEAKFIYGATKLRHRLGLAIAVHASMVVETLEALK